MVDLYKKAKMAFLLATEPSRVALEAFQLQKAMPKLLAESPQGDGHPVMVIPGFSTNDFYTKPLRSFLDKLGYKTYGWESGINAGLTQDKIDHLYNHLKKIYEENGCQKVTLIGHSLGGLEARVMAHEFPHMVRRVITLGSPFGISEHPDASPKLLVNTIQRLNDKQYTLEAPGMKERLLTPPKGIPTISVGSETDAIANWAACRNPLTDLTQDIKVMDASHAGMAFNPKVLSIVAFFAAQEEGVLVRYESPDKKRPENPLFEVTDENTMVKKAPPVAQRKPATEQDSKPHRKPTFPSNLGRRRPGGRPS